MAAGKGYSAGAIFLEVVPVFRNVQNAIESESKGWERTLGDRMEKAGDEAGTRAGKAMGESMDKEIKKSTDGYAGHFETSVQRMVKNAQKELDRLDLSTASEKMLKDLERAKAKLKELSDQDFNLDFDAKKVLADIQAVKAAVEGITKGDHELNIDANLRQVIKDAERVEQVFDKATRDRKVEVDVDTKPAERALTSFERNFKKTAQNASKALDEHVGGEVQRIKKDLDGLADAKIGVDISSNRARAELRALMKELDTISLHDPDIDVKVDTAKAYAELAAFEAALRKIEGQKTSVRVDASSLGGVNNGLLGTKRNSDAAANSFRSFNMILLAAASLGPAIVPVLAAIAGGLLAIGPAAAAAAGGLAGALIGFSGLGTALQALQARQKAQGMMAQTAGKQNAQAGYAIKDALQGVADAERNAAQAAQDAAQRVADAKRQAAEAIRSALEQQESAQRSYAQSVQDVQDAEQALRDARAEAAGTGHAIKDKIKDNNLAITQAQLDSAAATNNYNAVMADGSSTNTERIQAKHDRDVALQNLHELRDEQKDLAKQKKKWDKEGVDGTDSVQSAQDALTAAIQQQQDAYRALQDAAHQVDQARAEGARNVQRAVQDQNRTLADNARNIARADEALRRARENQGQTFDQLTTQQNAVDAAFRNLGPAGKKFALFLFHLQNRFQKWRQGVQAAMLPSIQSAIEGFIGSKSAGFLSDWITNMARGFGQFAQALSKSFQGPVWTEFFKTMADMGPKIQRAYGHAFIKLMEAFASILTTLAPFALEFARGLARMMDAFAGWAKSKAGADAINQFLVYVHQVGPRVLKLVASLAGAMLNLMEAMAPYAGIILDIVIAVLDFLANLDTGKLGSFVAALFAVITASQIAYATMNFLMAGTALLSSTVGVLVFALIGLALAVVYVYKHNKTLGIILGIVGGAVLALVAGVIAYNAVAALWAAIQTGIAAATYGTVGATYAQSTASKVAMAATKAWMLVTRAATFVMLAFNAVMDANPIALIILAIIALIAIIVILWKKNDAFHDAVVKAWDVLKAAFSAAWDVIGEVIGWIGDGIMWLWNKAIKPAMNAIGHAFAGVFNAVSWLWHHVLWPVLKAYGKVVWTLWKTYIKVALVLIKALFKVVFLAVKAYWDHYLHPVLSAIGAVLGWLWKNAIKPILGWIGDKWHDLMTGMKYAWDHYLSPVFDAIREKVLPKLKGAFETTVDAIKKAWDGLKAVVAKPIKFVIDKIINHGLIDGFNKVADWVHMDGFDYVDMPASLQSYATGGVLPGYTPGRDPHKFVSPTGGRLELSGGEAIMRPEWTAAMGPAYVNQMNALARKGGVNAIRQAMRGAYSLGGILPGAHIDPHDNYGHYAADFNVGGGYDDYGLPIHAYAKGFVRAFDYGYDNSYGRGVVIDHGTFQTLYAHMSRIAASAIGRVVNEGTTVGYVGDYGNTGTPPTSHLHFEIGSGWNLPWTSDPGSSDGNYGNANPGGESHHRSIPGFIKDLVLHPVDTVKGWVTSAWSSASDLVTQSPAWGYVKHTPEFLAGGMAAKAYDAMPGWVKSTLGTAANIGGAIKDGAGDLAHGASNVAHGIGDALGFANGGILPYNGTMMYDNGGYLAPGLTTVMNLTGKPEPVFTNDQWRQMGEGGPAGGTLHYEPHFEGTNLTAEDVASDLNFTFRRIRRGGKYAGVGQ